MTADRQPTHPRRSSLSRKDVAVTLLDRPAPARRGLGGGVVVCLHAPGLLCGSPQCRRHADRGDCGVLRGIPCRGRSHGGAPPPVWPNDSPGVELHAGGRFAMAASSVLWSFAYGQTLFNPEAVLLAGALLSGLAGAFAIAVVYPAAFALLNPAPATVVVIDRRSSLQAPGRPRHRRARHGHRRPFADVRPSHSDGGLALASRAAQESHPGTRSQAARNTRKPLAVAGYHRPRPHGGRQRGNRRVVACGDQHRAGTPGTRNGRRPRAGGNHWAATPGTGSAVDPVSACPARSRAPNPARRRGRFCLRLPYRRLPDVLPRSGVGHHEFACARECRVASTCGGPPAWCSSLKQPRPLRWAS